MSILVQRSFAAFGGSCAPGRTRLHVHVTHLETLLPILYYSYVLWPVRKHAWLLPTLLYVAATYHIAGIFRWAKFSRRPLWLYYSTYSRVEFSRNGSFAKN